MLRKLTLAAGRLAGVLGLAAGLWIAAPLDAAARGSFFFDQPVATLQSGGVPLAELPTDARQTYALIRTGGPFRYDKDGSVFGNYERQLPRANRGYYREYTVPTPGARNRGARRIICGGENRTRPEACYYTQDHYASFRLIVVSPSDQR